MKKPSLLLLMLVIVATSGSYVVTSAIASGRAPEDHQSSHDRVSHMVETIQEASAQAGFKLLDTTFHDEHLQMGRIEVSRYGNQNELVFVRRGWADQRSRGALMLFEENVVTLMNGGEPWVFAGISGVGQEYPAVGTTPPRLAFSWDEPSGTVTVFALLDGSIDRGTVERFIASLKR